MRRGTAEETLRGKMLAKFTALASRLYARVAGEAGFPVAQARRNSRAVNKNPRSLSA